MFLLKQMRQSSNIMYMAWKSAYIISLTLFLRTECVSFVKSAKQNVHLQVETEAGIVQGREAKTESGRSFFCYQGIPFAQPPIYNLRFRSPQPISKWSGVLDATKEAPSCIQIPFGVANTASVQSEDCLYLNVYSPFGPRYKEDLLPVYYFIHGGAFISGSPDFNTYGPQPYLEQNLVVVTANYRLGMFGFLSTEDEASPGNYGLKDQNAVLRWISRNIKNFGGDPNKVTLAGQSAGSCSVMYHVLSPMSRGLFHRAIAMSGDTLTSWSFQKSPRMVAQDVGMNFGIDTKNTTEFIETMRTIDSDVLKNGQVTVVIVNFLMVYHNGLVFTPVIEPNHKDAFITELSYNLLERGDFAKVPLVIGVTSMEMNLFQKIFESLRPIFLYFDLSPSSISARMNITSFARRRLVGNQVRKRYFKSNALSTSSPEELMQFLSDMFFVIPAMKSMRLVSKYVPVYFYVFTYKGEVLKNSSWPFQSDLKGNDLRPSLDGSEHISFTLVIQYISQLDGTLVSVIAHQPCTDDPYMVKLQNASGVAHAEDLIYMWETVKNITDKRDKTVCNRLHKLWSNFAEFGNPTPTIDPSLQNVTWPRVTGEENIEYLDIGEDLRILRNYRIDYMQFWDRLYEKYALRPFYTY